MPHQFITATDRSLIQHQQAPSFQNVADLGADLLKVDEAVVILCDPAGDDADVEEVVAISGGDMVALPEGRRALARALLRDLVSRHGVLRMLRAESMDPAGRMLSAAGFSSALVVPIRSQGSRVAGAICALQTRDTLWSDREIRLLGRLADCAEDANRARDALVLSEAFRRSEQRRGELRDFAYAVSHDLKSPANTLSLLLTEIGLNLGDRGDLGDTRDLIEMCSGTVTRMRGLIEDVLLYTRSIECETVAAPVLLQEVCSAVMQDMHGPLLESGGRIGIAALPAVMGCESQLRVLVQNLLANAIKFRHPDRPPDIAILSEPGGEGRVRIVVRDNGIGIDEANIGRIFQLFQRLHQRETYEGSGIGLSICKRIAENHGTRIDVLSQPGVGTSMSFELQEVRHV